MVAYYPVFLQLNHKKCVVVGGGEVAERKVNSLLQSGAEVEVISPDLCSGLRQAAQKGLVRVVARKFNPGDLEGAFLAIAATDDRQVNSSVAQEAQKNGILVNVVDDPAQCTFIVPAVLRRGDLALAVSTSGRSPVLAKKIREKLEQYFGQEYALLLDLLSEVHLEFSAKGQQIPPQVWEDCLAPDFLDLLRRGEKDVARNRLLASPNPISPLTKGKGARR